MSTEVKVAVLPDCDIHKQAGKPATPAAYDGKTRRGPWAYMCEECFQVWGVGLGTGRGQLLILEEGK